jgi:hypothetical protein
MKEVARHYDEEHQHQQPLYPVRYRIHPSILYINLQLVIFHLFAFVCSASYVAK